MTMDQWKGKTKKCEYCGEPMPYRKITCPNCGAKNPVEDDGVEEILERLFEETRAMREEMEELRQKQSGFFARRRQKRYAEAKREREESHDRYSRRTPDRNGHSTFDSASKGYFDPDTHSSYDPDWRYYDPAKHKRRCRKGKRHSSAWRRDVWRLVTYCLILILLAYSVYITLNPGKIVFIPSDKEKKLVEVKDETKELFQRARGNLEEMRSGIREVVRLALTVGQEEALARCRELLEKFKNDRKTQTLLRILEQANRYSINGGDLTDSEGGAAVEHNEYSKQGKWYSTVLQPGAPGTLTIPKSSIAWFDLSGLDAMTLEMVLFTTKGVLDLGEDEIDWENVKVIVRGMYADRQWVTLKEFDGFGRDGADKKVCVDVAGVRMLEIEFVSCRVEGGWPLLRQINLVKIGNPTLVTYFGDANELLDAAA